VQDTDLTHTLLLASSSPRRLELLQRTGFRCLVRVPEVDETRRPAELPVDYVARLARAKAAAVKHDPLASAVVAADTVVTQGDEILGKPADQTEARRMIAALSGGRHTVMTGFVVARPGEPVAAEVVETEVRFKSLSDHEIDCYVSTGEWHDKAGGYGVQGRAAFLVETLRGSYTNIVGLPLAEVVERLARLGVVPSAPAMRAAKEARA
jgi:nucleoside triphosphate pyrophosphatase